MPAKFPELLSMVKNCPEAMMGVSKKSSIKRRKSRLASAFSSAQDSDDSMLTSESESDGGSLSGTDVSSRSASGNRTNNGRNSLLNQLASTLGKQGANDLSGVLAKVNDFTPTSLPSCRRGRCTEREKFYAELLVELPEVGEHVDSGWLGPGQLKDLAALFAELDMGLQGSLLPHDVGYFLNRIGRPVTADDLVRMLVSMGEGIHGQCKFDFLDLVELVGGLRHNENELVSSAFDEFMWKAGNVTLHTVGEFLDTCGLSPRREQVRQVAASLELLTANEGNAVQLTTRHQLTKLVELCRGLERERFLERAGFLREQLEQLQEAFELFEEGEVSAQVQRRALTETGLLQESSLGCQSPASAPSSPGHGSSGPTGVSLWVEEDDDGGPFLEFLHYARRLIYYNEIRSVELERQAASDAGLDDDEAAALRTLYNALVREEVREEVNMVASGSNPRQGRRQTIAANAMAMTVLQDAVREEFTYVMLAKAARLFGVVLTVEQDAVLQARFREHAQPSKKRCLAPTGALERLHLTFPDFLLVIGWLWRNDFAGLRRATGRRVRSMGAKEKISHLAQVAQQYAQIIGQATLSSR